MPVPAMPAVVVLILCKTVVVGPPDPNDAYTNHQTLEWATENSMMVCRSQQVMLYDQAVDGGAAPQPFDSWRCRQAGISIASQWDANHKSSPYKLWRFACPVAVMDDNGTPEDSRDDHIVDWAIPDCGHRDTVVCEGDTAI